MAITYSIAKTECLELRLFFFIYLFIYIFIEGVGCMKILQNKQPLVGKQKVLMKFRQLLCSSLGWWRTDTRMLTIRVIYIYERPWLLLIKSFKVYAPIFDFKGTGWIMGLARNEGLKLTHYLFILVRLDFWVFDLLFLFSRSKTSSQLLHALPDLIISAKLLPEWSHHVLVWLFSHKKSLKKSHLSVWSEGWFIPGSEVMLL